ncbi:sulfate transporter family-domain-containing protein [Mycena albidolilacea]|uniref:Sulfate transporter family-domain-containing protein n=1 Tax=Mycena albidolilacea TaxID=1033008 RepID=A0AAD7EEQ7_9AGAR|nr:sulfate transporter family-domain-containing protein [Mycena albidolilacea]
MDVLRTRSVRFVSSFPVRLYRALPAVILGTLLNILDVSTGILVFPENGAFRSLQLQGISLFIMSGLTSQIVMTLGGSRFPGAMGTMLIEILPFLRGIANDIRIVLGDDHPGLVPTVMAAYALTSFLTGTVFFILGIVKLGNLVAYFPQTVLTGAIGALGVSLFVLGLGLPFPSSATPPSLSNVRSTLFDKCHLGLLAASFFPAFILSVSLRSRYIELWTRRVIRSAYYIPISFLMIPTVFWITVRALKVPNERLVATGWLFAVESASSSSSGMRLVEWWSLKSASQNIILLVVIGVLNVPIYVPALAFTLDVSYNMNYELLGQGAANIFAGLVGTVPNMLQYSYSVYITRAKGGRFELSLVILLTSALFLCSGHILPYVPTILASAVVLFFGIELFLEAIWEASKTLAWMEYAVVMVTLAACTFLGFAEGFGGGIGAAAAVYFVYGVIDSPARVTRWNERNEIQQLCTEGEDHVAAPIEGRIVSPHTHTPAWITLNTSQSTLLPTSMASADLMVHEDKAYLLQNLNARVVVLSGYIFFASIPSLERALLEPPVPPLFFILDLTHAHRIETAVARVLLRCVRELGLKDNVLVVCGVREGGGLHADFIRAKVPLGFGFDTTTQSSPGIAAFKTRKACLVWCQREREKRLLTASSAEGLDDQVKDTALTELCRFFDLEPSTVLGASTDDLLQSSTISRLTEAGRRVSVYLPGDVIRGTAIALIVEGEIDVRIAAAPSTADTGVSRPSVQRMLAMVPHEALRAARARLSGSSSRGSAPTRVLKAGDVLNGTEFAVSKTRTVVVELVGGERLTAWA